MFTTLVTLAVTFTPPAPTPTPVPTIAEIDAAAPALCRAVEHYIADGMTPFDVVVTGMLYWEATFPGAGDVVTEHLHGVLVGCAA